MKEKKDHLNIDLDFLGEEEISSPEKEKSHAAPRKAKASPTTTQKDDPEEIEGEEETASPKKEKSHTTPKKTKPAATTTQKDEPEESEYNDNASRYWRNPLFIFILASVLSSLAAVLLSSTTSDSSDTSDYSEYESLTSDYSEYEPPTNEDISIAIGRIPEAVNTEDLVVTGEYLCSQYHADKSTELEKDYSFLPVRKEILSQQEAEIDQLWDGIQYSATDEYSPQWEIDNYNEKVNIYNDKRVRWERDIELFNSQAEAASSQIRKYNNYLIEHCTPNK